MFKKILIANRGEIACRVIATAQKMRIKTVAVYSDADRRALHVRQADEAVRIGPSPAAESYLVMERIIQACKETGADAVHPGYGFLSENAVFAEALAAEGITFIAPPVGAIKAMGDKIESKKIAMAAGVNTIPGFAGVIETIDQALSVANEIGYPVMIKASAGGGGKGMRVARTDAECVEGFERAANEARNAFGDDRLLIEKYIEEPRHIEIQIIADRFGNTLYLGERECSLQRRHQKVIEESPSPFLDPKTRKAMGEQAVALARAVDYCSAGTVEFIVDRDKKFYFLEMNTRLQVEHPVTELVTGLDLVELMIRVAAGQDLQMSQEQITLTGWAIESRVYAEDPFRKFLPSIGRLTRYIPPALSPNVRVDTGVYEGGEVSMYYDPMIAKLITYGETRIEATNRMREALDSFYIRGVSHNISFLQALIAHPRFVEGRLSTNLIAEEFPDGFHPANLPHENPEMPVVLAAAIHYRYMARAAQITGQLPGHEKTLSSLWVVRLSGDDHPVKVTPAEEGLEVVFAGRSYLVQSRWRLGEPLFHGSINSQPICVQVERPGLGYRLLHGGSQIDLLVLAPRAALLNHFMKEKEAADLSRFLLSPMPGLLLKIAVAAGDEIKAGEELVVIEAMKMENVMRADRDAVVKEVLAKAGDSLSVDQPIIEFELTP